MAMGNLLINSVAMTTPGWRMQDLSPLWFPPDVRGSNVIIPGTAGRRAYTKRVDETSYDLPMLIYHTVNISGSSYADHYDGLQENVAYLYANVVAPTIGTTVAAMLTYPSGSTASADVQCELELSQHLGVTSTLAVLTVTVPAGRFA